MNLTPYKVRKLHAPKDDLFSAFKESDIKVKDGDVIVVSSKVVSIHEGRCILNDGSTGKDEWAMREASLYISRPQKGVWRPLFTITQGILIGVAGIDESNGLGHLVLYPKDPMKSAEKIKHWLQKEYGCAKIGVIISDSRSTPLRRGASGVAVGWAGIEPLKDYRGTKDLFGRELKVEVANIVDAIATSAVLVMGEGDEQTPVVLVRGAPVVFTNRKRPGEKEVKVSLEDDLFSVFFKKVSWKKGKGV